ncbi:DNA-methyltransferase [Leifsonia sp. NPDC014704]|uniref:DNA-methyltransferase n=1 Tax=Leifsonia sp. NPDC014704 TaxID=3364123 RepID=UPI0036F46765
MTTPYYQDDLVTIHHGDCLDILRSLPDESVHAVVTDPPYGLSATDQDHVTEALTHWLAGDRDFLPSTGSGFMGKAWDAFVPPVAVWDEALRVLKPGGHLLAFAGSRTHDLMALAIRMAGFELRDSIAWLYGSGFPKSHDVSKAVHDALGAERAKVRKPSAASAYSANAGNDRPWMQRAREDGFVEVAGDEPATEAAREWRGWGTALKPAFEPIVVARKPLAGTVASNVLAHRTGALNIQASRTGTDGGHRDTGENSRSPKSVSAYGDGLNGRSSSPVPGLGRWPTNVVLDDTQAAVLDEQAPDTGAAAKASGPTLRGATTSSAAFGARRGFDGEPAFYGDRGGASRFFPTFRYEPKAPTSERPKDGEIVHPTVKPLDLMRWLVRLVTPPEGIVLEPFAGSGTTVEAALLEGFRCIAVEREADYLPLIVRRISKPLQQSLFGEWEVGA